jgi:hypothetical protein
MKRRWLILFVAVALLLLAGMATVGWAPNPLEEKFQRLELGMTQKQVGAILEIECDGAASFSIGFPSGRVRLVFGDDSRLLEKQFERQPLRELIRWHLGW